MNKNSDNTRKEPFEAVAKKGGSITLALLEDKTIIGFAVLDDPSATGCYQSMGK